MPLTEADLKQTSAVFNEIKKTFPPNHTWTAKDLRYTPPPDAWLAKTRKTRPRAGVDIPVTYEVKLYPNNLKDGDAPVSIVGIDLTTQKEIEHPAGFIAWK
jgi:hypothetical protein